MIKAVFFDIDGTILSYRTHQMLPGTIEAINTLRSKGILSIISSGRPMVLIPDFPVEMDGYITVNGGYCFVGNEIIVDNAISDDDCQRWLSFVEQNGKTTMCFTKDEMFINRIDDMAISIQEQMGIKMPQPQPLSAMGGKKVYQFIAIQHADKDAETQAVLPNCRTPRWHPLFTDIIPGDSSKAVGIERILAHFGLTRDEAAAFGDGANDIEMLEYVGCGIAMGNANPILKQHADMVTDDADNEGIFNALKLLKLI